MGLGRTYHYEAGQLLRSARNLRGYTLRETANKVGLTGPTDHQFLQRCESGLQRVPFNRLDALCAVLGIKSLEIRQLYAKAEIDRIKIRYGLK